MGGCGALDVAAVHGALGSMEAAAPSPACCPLPVSLRAAACTAAAPLPQPPACGSAGHLAIINQGKDAILLMYFNADKHFVLDISTWAQRCLICCVHAQVCGSCKPTKHSMLPESGVQCSNVDASSYLEKGSRSAAAAMAMEQPEIAREVSLGGDTATRTSSNIGRRTRTLPNTTSSEYGTSARDSEARDMGAMPSKRPDACENSSHSEGARHLKNSESPLVCIDFGSMGSMGLLGDAKHLVEVLALALRGSGLCGILLTGIACPLTKHIGHNMAPANVFAPRIHSSTDVCKWTALLAIVGDSGQAIGTLYSVRSRSYPETAGEACWLQLGALWNMHSSSRDAVHLYTMAALALWPPR